MARLKLHVSPGSRDERINGWRGDVLWIKVRARAEKGRANEAIVKLLARQLRLPRSAIHIVRGMTSREKLIDVDGLSASDLYERLT